MRKRYAIFLCGLGLAGCQNIEAPKQPLVETVAVLPFDSESNDVNAPDIMQELVAMALAKSCYKVSEVKAVNEKLESAGIVDGGQLAVIDPTKLGKDLNVQALMFGNVESFDYTNIGFYLQRKVTLELRMVEVASGQTIWENSGSKAHRELNLEKDKAANAFVRGIADQAVEKLFNSPLEEEAKLATISALRTLPGFAFVGFSTEGRSSKAGSSVKDSIRNAIRKK